MSLLNNPKVRAYLKRKYGAAAGGGPPTSSPLTLVQNGTVYIPMGFAARLRVYARDDAGIVRDSDAGAFESSDNGIFRVVSVVDVRDALDATVVAYWEVLLAAVSVGTATLSEYVDAEEGNSQNESVVPVTDTLTVVVHNIATELVAYFTEEGGGSEMQVQDIGGGTFFMRLPSNKNATLRVEGRVGKAIVPLSNVVFDSRGSSNFHFVATSDPSIVTLVTDAQTILDGFGITADGDPSPNTANLSLDVTLAINSPIATTLVEYYALEPR